MFRRGMCPALCEYLRRFIGWPLAGGECHGGHKIVFDAHAGGLRFEQDRGF
jgi:hypothetical protein